MYLVNSPQRTLHVPLVVNATTRQLYLKLDLNAVTGAVSFPENDRERTLPETLPYLKDLISPSQKIEHFTMANQLVPNAIPGNDWERSSRRTAQDLTLSCDKNQHSIRLENLPVPTSLHVDGQCLSDGSFYKLSKIVRKIKVEDFNAIVTAVSCMNGFEKRYLGFIKADDRNSRFDLDGTLRFKSPSGQLKSMYFRLDGFVNFDKLFKEIEGLSDFNKRYVKLGMLRNIVIASFLL